MTNKIICPVCEEMNLKSCVHRKRDIFDLETNYGFQLKGLYDEYFDENGDKINHYHPNEKIYRWYICNYNHQFIIGNPFVCKICSHKEPEFKMYQLKRKKWIPFIYDLIPLK